MVDELTPNLTAICVLTHLPSIRLPQPLYLLDMVTLFETGQHKYLHLIPLILQCYSGGDIREPAVITKYQS